MLRPVRALAHARARALALALAGAVGCAVPRALPLPFLALSLGLAMALVNLDLALAHLALELGRPAAPRGFVSCFGRCQWYGGTSIIRKRTPLRPYRRPMPRVLGGFFFPRGRAFFYGRGTPEAHEPQQKRENNKRGGETPTHPSARRLHSLPDNFKGFHPRPFVVVSQKSIFKRPCRFLAMNTRKMAPRTSKGLQERAWDAPT